MNLSCHYYACYLATSPGPCVPCFPKTLALKSQERDRRRASPSSRSSTLPSEISHWISFASRSPSPPEAKSRFISSSDAASSIPSNQPESFRRSFFGRCLIASSSRLTIARSRHLQRNISLRRLPIQDAHPRRAPAAPVGPQKMLHRSHSLAE